MSIGLSKLFLTFSFETDFLRSDKRGESHESPHYVVEIYNYPGNR